MEYDVIIAGGGLVGCTLAIALQKVRPDIRILIVESQNIVRLATSMTTSFDARATVLSEGSKQIYEQLGLWPQLQNQVCPIACVHVSDADHFGCTRIHHQSYHVPALGYVIENRQLGQKLLDATYQAPQITWLNPAEVHRIRFAPNQALVTAQDPEHRVTFKASLVVLADGGCSKLAEQLGFIRQTHDYQQKALVANISTTQPHRNIAYERFSSQSTLAMLPLTDERSAMVWTLPQAQFTQHWTMSDAALLERIQGIFGDDLGQLTRIGKRYHYPLLHAQLNEQVRPNLVVLGNAVHRLHPVAGQGYNLCLRDIMALVDVLASCPSPDTLGDFSTLMRYQRSRQKNQHQVSLASDHLVRCFESTNPATVLLRNLGLVGLERTPSLKRWLAHKAMGLS